MGGGSDINETSEKLGIPAEFLEEAEGFEEFEGIYPDNWKVANIFSDMATQWNVGMNGAVGLVYESLNFVFRVRKVEADEEGEIFSLLKIMERAVLERKNAES